MDNFPVLPPAVFSWTTRVLIVAGGLAVTVAVIWGATLAARHAPAAVKSVNDADSDSTAADAICSAGRREATDGAPLPARQAFSRRLSGAR
jgi:hypothetical protein